MAWQGFRSRHSDSTGDLLSCSAVMPWAENHSFRNTFTSRDTRGDLIHGPHFRNNKRALQLWTKHFNDSLISSYYA
uniref:Uncharacterized protein n=1 Tax=Gorilla gorilla gorilla TaxID=9595 RepID=A0A2I2YH20_GORGO